MFSTVQIKYSNLVFIVKKMSNHFLKNIYSVNCLIIIYCGLLEENASNSIINPKR